MAMRIVDEAEKDAFLSDVNAAKQIVNKEEKEKKLDELYSKFESNLTLLGGTAVEDRL